MCRPKWSRLGPTHLDFEGAWRLVLAWGQIWPTDPFLGVLPPCNISKQSKFHVATGNDFSFWFQMLPKGMCGLGFGRNLTSKFLMWWSTPM